MAVRRKTIEELSHNPWRMGRNIAHDDRSLSYPFFAIPYSALKSVRWERRIPVLDQGDIGSCTGNAATGWLGTDNARRNGLTTVGGQTLDEHYALGFYEEETHVDRIAGVYPPTDTGSSALALGKVLKKRGLATQYRHAFSLQSALTALQTGPVLLGLPWFSKMFSPARDGGLTVGGRLAGGHEIIADEIDVKNKRVWLTNSWGTSFGIAGRCYLTWQDLEGLLHEQGDTLVPIPVIAPS